MERDYRVKEVKTVGYGDKLKTRKNRERQARGRQSHKEGIKFAKGNLRYILEFLNPEEVVSLVSEITYEEYDSYQSQPPERQLRESILRDKVHRKFLQKSRKDRKKIWKAYPAELCKIRTYIIKNTILALVRPTTKNTMTKSVSEQFSRSNKATNFSQINLFCSNIQREEIACINCYEVKNPRTRESNIEGLNRLKCPDCGSDMLPKKLLDNLGKLIEENQKEAGVCASSQQESGVSYGSTD